MCFCNLGGLNTASVTWWYSFYISVCFWLSHSWLSPNNPLNIKKLWKLCYKNYRNWPFKVAAVELHYITTPTPASFVVSIAFKTAIFHAYNHYHYSSLMLRAFKLALTYLDYPPPTHPHSFTYTSFPSSLPLFLSVYWSLDEKWPGVNYVPVASRHGQPKQIGVTRMLEWCDHTYTYTLIHTHTCTDGWV